MIKALLCVVFLLSGLSLAALPARAADKLAVLFQGGAHLGYVVKPLVAMGIAVDVAPAGKLAEMLATGKYHVAVVTTMDAADRAAVDAFLAKGGGVFACNPEGAWHNDNWTSTNQWLETLGARPRWELLQDSDKANLYRDAMGCQLSWSTTVTAPVNDGVRGVLTLTWGSTTGLEPVMSFDFTKDWQVVVRGAATHQGVKETRHDVVLAPWVVKEPAPPAPPLMGVRQVGPGRLAVLGIRKHWFFSPPPNCPTVKAMLTAGVGDKSSDWLLVAANAFRWLAAPARKAGFGGAQTPDTVLNPPPQRWEPQKQLDWTDSKPVTQLPDQPQYRGLVGARTALSTGKGAVADYVTAAKAAGLQFIVFMEDSLAMDEAKWDQLVAQCTAHSDDTFLAAPGLTYEDAQGNHLYAFADNVRMLKPAMLLPDKRLATVQPMRSRAYFDYDNEYLGQQAIRGYWNHRANMIQFADYKLYNSFPIVSFENGRQIDNALGEYLYLQGIGGCQAPVAFEFMTDPAQVGKRAAEGWKIVSHRDLKVLNGKWHSGAYSFSGSGAQYITNGPQILVWQSPNRLSEPHGEWWRPDLWQYRLLLRVASEHGLKSVTLYDGDRQVLRRWLPDGQQRFQQEIVLANCQQLGPVLVVEDLKGRKAISAAFWNRNLNNEEFFCSDRCNFLGNARLRTRDGGQYWTQVSFRANMGITPSKGQLMVQAAPAVNLTAHSPTLPVDGAPAGFPTLTLDFYPRIPGEYRYLFAQPQTYLVGPEIGIGQADIRFAYDPLEEGAKFTPLGHPYVQPQHGWGNAWGSWHRLVPTQKVQGWQRIYAATWLTEGFRLGAVETHLTVKNSIDVPAQGLPVTYARGELWKGGKKIGGAETAKITGAFDRGVFCTLQDPGGAVIIIGTGEGMVYEYARGQLRLFYQPQAPLLLPGETVRHLVLFAGADGRTTTEEIVRFARQFGVLEPGKPGYRPAVTQGTTEDTYFFWTVRAKDGGVAARIPRADMPGFLTARVDGLNERWSVYLLDKALPASANVRALPSRDGRAWAQLDLNRHDSDLYLGHPVVAGDPRLTLTANWQTATRWYVEAHNPTAAPITTELFTPKAWTVFTFREKVTLAPGESRVWTVTTGKASTATPVTFTEGDAATSAW
ncbi:MAG: hypothetical protein ACYC7E_02680 [Armatimonadota bacterium]